MAELFTTRVLSTTNEAGEKQKESEGKQEISEFKEGDIFDWSSGLEEADDSQLYFAPELGQYLFKQRDHQRNKHLS